MLLIPIMYLLKYVRSISCCSDYSVACISSVVQLCEHFPLSSSYWCSVLDTRADKPVRFLCAM